MQRIIANAESLSKNKIIKYLRQLKSEQKSDKLQIPFTRQELADHLQMDISTLMRELKSLQESNVLTYEGKIITILNIWHYYTSQKGSPNNGLPFKYGL